MWNVFVFCLVFFCPARIIAAELGRPVTRFEILFQVAFDWNFFFKIWIIAKITIPMNVLRWFNDSVGLLIYSNDLNILASLIPRLHILDYYCILMNLIERLIGKSPILSTCSFMIHAIDFIWRQDHFYKILQHNIRKTIFYKEHA